MCLLASLLALKSGDNGECSVPMDIYYGLNVCVSRTFVCRNPDAQCDGLWYPVCGILLEQREWTKTTFYYTALFWHDS